MSTESDSLAQELKDAKGGIGKPTIVLSAAVLVVAAFFGGVWANKSFGSPAPAAAPPSQGGGLRGNGGNGANGGGFGGRGTAGTIDHVDGTTVYVKTNNGTVVKVSTSDSTKVLLTKPGALTDLTAGTTVTVQGQADSSGTVSAQTITQRPGQ